MPPTDPQPIDALLDKLERLEKAATPRPWACGGGKYLPITATRNGLHCQIGRAESCGFHDISSEEIEANGGLIAAFRNAAPRLIAELRQSIAIARAAKEMIDDAGFPSRCDGGQWLVEIDCAKWNSLCAALEGK